MSKVDDHLDAIALCLDNDLRTPALVLIYTGIDIMAALSRPALVKKTGKRQFIKWAEHHMGCQERIGVSGLDLYAARCGIVHTATAESSLSDDGNARRIFYSWGHRDKPEPTAGAEIPGRTDVVVRIEDLADALCASVALFRREVRDDPVLASLVRRRSGKLFMVRAAAP
ncbi:hypothetical protein ACIU1J_00970 [Azospirillum doebereinerae]|uniref:hypothetical protein n=1 Tax=Azospirillum doebereinerae TaxID=92933 RepID=UPI001EE59F5A|nr:hypothetical protein [Azospirillum doebereinerae]MCG5239215.1 hypothetical protein [Azospirillum doebereinerae]